MRIKSWSITDVGLKRDHNEDSHFRDDDLMLYVVADGMGGHAAGETASRTAIETISKEVEALEDGLDGMDASQVSGGADDPVQKVISKAIQRASKAILDQVSRNPNLHGMGTTVSALLFLNDHASYGHVGDSRIYRIRNGNIQQISTDHSLVQEQVDAGIITQEEAEKSKFKNIITRSVGFESHVEVDTAYVPVQIGDRFLLCSDGLTNNVRDDEIVRITETEPAERALEALIQLTNQRGGDDNSTIVFVEVIEGPEEEILPSDLFDSTISNTVMQSEETNLSDSKIEGEAYPDVQEAPPPLPQPDLDEAEKNGNNADIFLEEADDLPLPENFEDKALSVEAETTLEVFTPRPGKPGDDPPPLPTIQPAEKKDEGGEGAS